MFRPRKILTTAASDYTLGPTERENKRYNKPYKTDCLKTVCIFIIFFKAYSRLTQSHRDDENHEND